MNTVLPNDPLSAPHLFVNRFSSSRGEHDGPSLPLPMLGQRHHGWQSWQSNSNALAVSESYNNQSMSGRKRKASEEPTDHDRMSTSPSGSPAMSNRRLPSAASSSTPTHRSIKRTRNTTLIGRPLPLPRLLETLSADSLRHIITSICDNHPSLQREIASYAPPPTLETTLTVLNRYEAALTAAFPLGPRPTSDYAYNRVRTQQAALVDAVREHTPRFLPPHETQDGVALAYLDAVTAMVHRLPDWDSFANRRAKEDAYEEIARAWALVVREAGKRAGGFHLRFGGWDRKVLEHDAKSGGRMAEAVEELKSVLGTSGEMESAAGEGVAGVAGVSDERLNIRQQLFAGTYGQQQLGVGPGGW